MPPISRVNAPHDVGIRSRIKRYRSKDCQMFRLPPQAEANIRTAFSPVSFQYRGAFRHRRPAGLFYSGTHQPL